MRNIFFIVLTLMGSISMQTVAQSFETATEAVKNMRIGWNLGNTLESNSGDTLNMWIEHWTDRSPSKYETAWGQPVVNPALFQMLKQAGFNAVRVPVTWYPHMEATFQFKGSDNSIWYPWKDPLGTQIQQTWIKRVHQVVDYVISQGMYCILNVHHDTGASNTAWLIADEKVYNQQHQRFEAVWQQIAEEFRDYDEHLLFEGYNEMLDSKRSWCFASFGANGGYDASIAKSAYNAINSYAQSFVNTIRATGGNNLQRNLVVCTYGACDGSGTWNSHLKDPLKEMKLPEDVVSEHLIFEVHSYPKIDNLTTAKNEVSNLIKSWNSHLISKGAPLIVGEWGTSTDNAYENHRDNYLEFAKHFIAMTKSYNIGTFHWMGLTDGEHRSVPEFNQPDLVEAIIKGYYGEEGYTGVTTITADRNEMVDVYSLHGVRLLHQVPYSQLQSLLKSGIYVVRGKKIIVR